MERGGMWATSLASFTRNPREDAASAEARAEAERGSQTESRPERAYTCDPQFIRQVSQTPPEPLQGHGTYMDEDKLHASVAGIVERVNKLICVKPLKTRYNGEIGDVVIGRITEVGTRRWKVDIHAKLDSVLMLSSVNLPGGELECMEIDKEGSTLQLLTISRHMFGIEMRRRSEEDERMMRDYLIEGDLISAEVQSIYADGALSLHTRSLKYGKLSQGTLVQVSPSLVKRRKTHFHNLPCGASLILGNNGYLWICPTINEDTDNTGGFVQNLEPVCRSDREVISRLRNCILALSQHRMMLYDTSIIYAFEASSRFSIKEILQPEVAQEVVDLTRGRLEQES